MKSYKLAQLKRNEAGCGFLAENAEVFEDDVSYCVGRV